jgi:hypothetical protein
MPANKFDPVYPESVALSGQEVAEKSSFYNGLSLQQHFSSMAMQGLLSTEIVQYPSDPEVKQKLVSIALDYADELIKQLNERNKND